MIFLRSKNPNISSNNSSRLLLKREREIVCISNFHKFLILYCFHPYFVKKNVGSETNNFTISVMLYNCEQLKASIYYLSLDNPHGELSKTRLYKKLLNIVINLCCCR